MTDRGAGRLGSRQSRGCLISVALCYRPPMTHTFFQPGTVQIVYRPRLCRRTVAVTIGHALQWAGVRMWARVLHLQAENPRNVNEYMSDVAKYLSIAGGFVNDMVKIGEEDHQ